MMHPKMIVLHRDRKTEMPNLISRNFIEIGKQPTNADNTYMYVHFRILYTKVETNLNLQILKLNTTRKWTLAGNLVYKGL